MALAAVLVVPFGVGSGDALLHPSTLVLGVAVAALAGLVPFSLEMVALRHVPARVFGVLMSLSPVVASVVGLILLGQQLGLIDVVAMAMVIVASVATVRARQRSAPADEAERSR
jgi:inner membrane transporter RhtA